MAKRRKRKVCRKQNRFILLLSATLFISVLFFILYETKIRPVICEVAVAQAQSVAVTTLNDELNRIIATESIGYDDLVVLQKDAQNRISAITTDMAKVSRLKSKIAVYVQEKMREVDRMTMRIPLGTLVSNGLFSGYGPRIPIRLTSVGRAIVDIEDSFIEAGINQTRHEIHLLVTAKISVLMPGGATITEIHTKIPIAQSVIVGEVPQSVTNVTGLDDDPQDTILNFMDE